jgi:hypothetical protein
MSDPDDREYSEKFKLSIEVPSHVRHDKDRLRDWLDSVATEIHASDEIVIKEDEEASTDDGGDVSDWVRVTITMGHPCPARIPAGNDQGEDGDDGGEDDGSGGHRGDDREAKT